MPSGRLNNRFSLLADTGIQFLDTEISASIARGLRHFVRRKASGPLIRVAEDPQQHCFYLPADNSGDDEIVRPEYQVPLSECLTVYADNWLPVPFFRQQPDGKCSHGPVNWVRVFISPPEVKDRHHSLTLAFDTTAGDQQTRDLQPDRVDCDNGQHFAPAWRDHDLMQFLEYPWLNQWLQSVFACQAPAGGLSSATRFSYQAHYLNLLELISIALPCEAMMLLPSDGSNRPAEVDLLLDIGNSHSCGIISEQHPQQDNPLLHSSELILRDLSRPARRGAALFSSEIAFAPCPLDKYAYSAASGRSSVFLWPSIVRTGDEARRLTRTLNQSGGMQGVSSPRRYSWDDNIPEYHWYYPPSASGEQPAAIRSPFTLLMDDQARMLDQLPAEHQFPVCHAGYPRSSLLMFMLCELISQAFCQMNSHSHRQKMPGYSAPRHLRSILLTLPAAMSPAEKDQVLQLARQAVMLVRQSLTRPAGRAAHPDAERFWHPLPRVIAEADEASCGQLLWLYSQPVPRSGDNAVCDRLINDWQLPGRSHRGLRIALIDIGGGTTDVSVSDYLPVGSPPVLLRPELLYRSGYPLAGEDLLYDLVRTFLLPALQEYLQQQGLARAATVVRQLFAPGSSCEGDTPWRQQFSRQFFRPLALKILENYRQAAGNGQCESVAGGTAGDLLADPPDHQVMAYFSQRVSDISAVRGRYDACEMPVTVSFTAVEAFFNSENFRAAGLLTTMCDNVRRHQPDVLLFSGKNSALPAIRQLLTRNLPLPPGHIISLDRLRCRESMPFCRNGELIDGKCSAITGAFIHQLIRQQRLYPRYIAAGQYAADNIIRELGIITPRFTLPCSQVLLRLPATLLPASAVTFELLLVQRVSLGYRTSGDPRLPASPLLSVSLRATETEGCDKGVQVTLRWLTDSNGQLRGLPEVIQVTADGQQNLPLSLVVIRLNTLATSGQPCAAYWSDDGRIDTGDDSALLAGSQ